MALVESGVVIKDGVVTEPLSSFAAFESPAMAPIDSSRVSPDSVTS